MQQINVVNGPQNASRIILGCMRMPALSAYESADMIRAAAEEGIIFLTMPLATGTEKQRPVSGMLSRYPA